MSRPIHYALSVAALAIAFGGLWWHHAAQEAAFHAGFERIHPGMSECQAVALLGGPAARTIVDGDVESCAWHDGDQELWIGIDVAARVVVAKWRADRVAGGSRVRP